MKKQGHPHYQDVLFIDSSTGYRFVCGSTLSSKEKEVFEGKEYPVCRVSISSASHPIFTGSKLFVDTEGRVDKFQKRYAAKRQEVQKEENAKEISPSRQKTASKKTKKTK